MFTLSFCFSCSLLLGRHLRSKEDVLTLRLSVFCYVCNANWLIVLSGNWNKCIKINFKLNLRLSGHFNTSVSFHSLSHLSLSLFVSSLSLSLSPLSCSVLLSSESCCLSYSLSLLSALPSISPCLSIFLSFCPLPFFFSGRTCRVHMAPY